jgi:hypothetical protein
VGVKEDIDAGRDKSTSRTTIFHQLLDPNVTEGHIVPSVDDLKDEAYIIVAAAADTTGNAMTIAAYNIVSDETIYRKLTTELRDAFPDPGPRLEFTLLEKLPCLVCRFQTTRVLRPSDICRLQLSRKRLGVLIPAHCLLVPNLMFSRLSFGVIGRLPRVTPEPGAVFNGYTVPGGVCLWTVPCSLSSQW